MKAKDFLYGERTLSSFGCVICNFGNKGLETIDGAEITFNTISSFGGSKYNLTSTQYESCLESTIQICKYSCKTNIQEISPTEYREISRWLNRKKFLKLKIFDEQYIDIYYYATVASINRIEIDGRLMGLELHIITDSPHAFKEPKVLVRKNPDGENGEWNCSISDISYEEGFIYPYTEITIGDIGADKGNLSIYNALENRETYIANCTTGEIITMDYPIITSSDSSHKIQNDFNWNFFRVANTYKNNRNDLTISIPCTIKIKYSPIVKVGL